MEKDTFPAVKALIEEDGKLLAIKGGDTAGGGSRWDLPGRVEYGESHEEALKREVREEVSLEIDVGEAVGAYDFFYRKHHILPVVFKCSPRHTDIELQEGIDGYHSVDEFEWLRPEEFVDRETVSDLKRVISGFYGL